MKAVDGFYDKVAKDSGLTIHSYTELLEKIADLSYDYPRHILYFRGQTRDYTTSEGRSTLYPSIYRGMLSKELLKERFRLLDASAHALIDVSKKYSLKGISEMRKKRQILWSVLQHYEICDTPLLDITHSLRVACTFALAEENEYGYIYVLALPYLTNRITYNSEEDILLVRLLSISPPAAKRPFYQEGYVMGTPDITIDYDRKRELDATNRLVAKYKIINNKHFWGRDFSPLSSEFIYPVEDEFGHIRDEVIDLRRRGFHKDKTGDFLALWNRLEAYVREIAVVDDYVSINRAYRKHAEESLVFRAYLSKFDEIRKFRNRLVYEAESIGGEELDKFMEQLKSLCGELGINIMMRLST